MAKTQDPGWNRKWRAANPQAVRAHWIVQEAMRQGKLERQPCEECGEAKTHAHHDDYAKPLAVRWLCPACHRRHHAALAPPRAHKVPKPRKPRVYVPHPIIYPKDILSERARELRSEGFTYAAIGAQLGVTKGTVYKWLNDTTYH